MFRRMGTSKKQHPGSMRSPNSPFNIRQRFRKVPGQHLHTRLCLQGSIHPVTGSMEKTFISIRITKPWLRFLKKMDIKLPALSTTYISDGRPVWRKDFSSMKNFGVETKAPH